MRIRYMLIAVAAAAAVPSIAPAQTTALNPNLMTSWTGGAAVQDDLDRRAGNGRHASGASARQNCRRVPEFRAKYGARDQRVRQLRRLCRRAGY